MDWWNLSEKKPNRNCSFSTEKCGFSLRLCNVSQFLVVRIGSKRHRVWPKLLVRLKRSVLSLFSHLNSWLANQRLRKVKRACRICWIYSGVIVRWPNACIRINWNWIVICSRIVSRDFYRLPVRSCDLSTKISLLLIGLVFKISLIFALHAAAEACNRFHVHKFLNRNWAKWMVYWLFTHDLRFRPQWLRACHWVVHVTEK